jgi:hypothetical protein
MRRAEFYWRSGRNGEAGKDVSKYWEIKKSGRSEEKELVSREVREEEISEFEQKIAEKVGELQSLLIRMKQSNGPDPQKQQLSASFSKKEGYQ